jgi:hypothetical protein
MIRVWNGLSGNSARAFRRNVEEIRSRMHDEICALVREAVTRFRLCLVQERSNIVAR